MYAFQPRTVWQYVRLHVRLTGQQSERLVRDMKTLTKRNTQIYKLIKRINLASIFPQFLNRLLLLALLAF